MSQAKVRALPSRETTVRQPKAFKGWDLIKGVGLACLIWHSLVLLAIFTGNWLGIDEIYPSFKLVAMTLTAVCVVAQFLCWILADQTVKSQAQ